jgi:transcriptional regulator with XRE-family HTH domain
MSTSDPKTEAKVEALLAELAVALLELRKQGGSQLLEFKEIAEQVGIDPNTYRKTQGREHIPKLDNFIRIAAALDRMGLMLEPWQLLVPLIWRLEPEDRRLLRSIVDGFIDGGRGFRTAFKGQLEHLNESARVASKKEDTFPGNGSGPGRRVRRPAG